MSERAKKLVTFGNHTLLVDEIIGFRIDLPPEPYGPTTLVWVRTHHGQWSFSEKGDHGDLLREAMLEGLPPMTEPLPTAKDREAFQYVIDNSDPEADADDPFVRIAKWALARPA